MSEKTYIGAVVEQQTASDVILEQLTNFTRLDWVLEGMGFTVDYTTPSLDIAAGKAYLIDDNTSYRVEPEAVSDIPLTDADTNHVYLVVDTTGAHYHVSTTKGGLPKRSLYLGSVDTSANSVSLSNDASRLSPDEMIVRTEAPQDVTASRSAGTWYQNTTGTTLAVTAQVSIGSGTDTQSSGHINDSEADNKVWASDSTLGSNSVTLTVPDEFYYKVTKGANNTLDKWFEQRLGFA